MGQIMQYICNYGSFWGGPDGHQSIGGGKARCPRQLKDEFLARLTDFWRFFWQIELIFWTGNTECYNQRLPQIEAPFGDERLSQLHPNIRMKSHNKLRFISFSGGDKTILHIKNGNVLSNQVRIGQSESGCGDDSDIWERNLLERFGEKIAYNWLHLWEVLRKFWESFKVILRNILGH